MAERFASVSEDELCRLIEEKDSKNTKRATKASVKVFNECTCKKRTSTSHIMMIGSRWRMFRNGFIQKIGKKVMEARIRKVP